MERGPGPTLLPSPVSRLPSPVILPRLTSPRKPGRILTISIKEGPLPEKWHFTILLQEPRSRRLILEGQAHPPYERPYHDPLVFYTVMGPDYLSLEVSRDFDGERLLAYLTGLLGQPADGPRIQVGGSQSDEEGALLLVEWRFPAAERGDMIKRLGEILEQPLG
jgi:hypothetical protein